MSDDNRKSTERLLAKYGRAEGGVAPDEFSYGNIATPEGYALAKLEAERQARERYNQTAPVPAPTSFSGSTRADFLRDEHDTRPYDDYRQRGWLLPGAKNPYTGEAINEMGSIGGVPLAYPSPVKALLDQIATTQRMRGEIAKDFRENPDKPLDMNQGPINKAAEKLIQSPVEAATAIDRMRSGEVPMFDYDMASGRLVPSQRAIGESTNLAGNLMIGGGLATAPLSATERAGARAAANSSREGGAAGIAANINEAPLWRSLWGGQAEAPRAMPDIMPTARIPEQAALPSPARPANEQSMTARMTYPKDHSLDDRLMAAVKNGDNITEALNAVRKEMRQRYDYTQMRGSEPPLSPADEAASIVNLHRALRDVSQDPAYARTTDNGTPFFVRNHDNPGFSFDSRAPLRYTPESLDAEAHLNIPPNTPQADLARYIRDNGIFSNASKPAGLAAMPRNLDPLGYYSKLDEVLGSFRPTDTVTAQTLAQRGVKQSELQARGLDGLLDRGGAKVKELIENTLPPTRLNESVYGLDLKKKDGFLSRLLGGIESGDVAQGAVGPPKWQPYSLDKGSNPTYRESVLSLPNREGSPYVMKDASGKVVGTFPNRDAAFEAYRKADLGVGSGIEPLTQNWPDFRSGHWQEPNVIAHLRSSIQKDAEGRPIYHLDELQSDWGQKIRDGGVRDEAKVADLTKSLAEVQKANANVEAQANAFVQRYGNEARQASIERSKINPFHQVPYGAAGDLEALANFGSADVQAEANKLWAAWKASDAEESRISAELWNAQTGVPGHPLVNTTDQWTTTALRRALQQAVDSGAEGISLTPGQLQADRFSLSKVADRLRYDPETKTLDVFGKGQGNLIHSQTATPGELPSIIGKDATNALLSSEIKQGRLGPKAPYHELQLDGEMTFGGEGMKTAYDKMYPKILQKELSRLDPEIKYGQTTLQGHEDKGPFHYFPLTDKAREEIKKGLPLFANSSKQAGTAALAMDEASRMARARELGFDTDKVLYHGTNKAFDEFKLGQPGHNSTIFGSEPTTRSAVFLAEHPDLAKEFAGQAGRTGKVMDLMTRVENPFDASKYGFSELPESFFEEHGLNQRYYYNLQPWKTWEAFDDANGGRDFVKALQSRGHDSVKLMDISSGAVPNTTSYAIFDPAHIRSTAAAFDPAQTHSPNLLAANASDKAAIPGIALANERKGITAYHGSPYAFDRFDPGKIGTGEGAQAYGYGHYFAGNEKVANEYRKALTGNHAGDIHIPTVDGVEVANPSQTLRNIIRDGGNAASFVERMKPRLTDAEAALQKARLGGDELETMLAETDYSRVKGIIDEASGLVGRRVGTKPAGHTYEVKINADPDHFLDWDKPLTQQPHVMAKMDSELPSYAHDNSPETVKMLRDNLGYSHVDTGKDVYEMGGRDVEGNQRYEDFARILRDKGIPGIRYLDQGSRSAGEGTRNYVVFPGNENIVEILRRYVNASMPAGIPGITLDRSSDRRRGAH